MAELKERRAQAKKLLHENEEMYRRVKALFHFPALHGKLIDSMGHGGLLMFQHVIEIPQTQEDHPIWDQQLRVAAYCRTSTNQEEQNSSLENQIAYYTAFIQSNALLGLGLMLSAGEVPRIAGTFGLDTTTHANIMSAVYTAQTAVTATRMATQAVAH